MLDFAIFAVTFLLALVAAVLYLYPVTAFWALGGSGRRPSLSLAPVHVFPPAGGGPKGRVPAPPAPAAAAAPGPRSEHVTHGARGAAGPRGEPGGPAASQPRGRSSGSGEPRTARGGGGGRSSGVRPARALSGRVASTLGGSVAIPLPTPNFWAGAPGCAAPSFPRMLSARVFLRVRARAAFPSAFCLSWTWLLRFIPNLLLAVFLHLPPSASEGGSGNRRNESSLKRSAKQGVGLIAKIVKWLSSSKYIPETDGAPYIWAD